MRTGWNLGNTFDAWSAPGSRLAGDVLDIETLWLGGRANATTQTLIQTVRAAGFDTLRIPVTWSKVADPDNNWEIRVDWLERVQQIVDWALEEDMFVILNAHHENAALQLGVQEQEFSNHPGYLFVTNIWRQIAEHFKDYDERLIFAALNEPRHEGGQDEWWGATREVRLKVNLLNQAFVDTVRGTGGNNVYRILQVPTVAAGATPNGMADFVTPQDPLNPDVNKIIWSIHTYSPFEWAHEGRGSYVGEGAIISALENVHRNALRLGLPLILGEWGSIHASKGEDADQDLRNIQRPLHAEDYVRAARERGMMTIVWDNGGFTGTDHTWGLIRRAYPHDISPLHQEVINGIMRGVGAYDYIREAEIADPPASTPENIVDPEPEPIADNSVDPEPEETETDANDVNQIPVADVTDTGETVADSGLGLWVWILISGAVVAIIVALVFAIKSTKK